jgi:hypothetical protein
LSLKLGEELWLRIQKLIVIDGFPGMFHFGILVSSGEFFNLEERL